MTYARGLFTKSKKDILNKYDQIQALQLKRLYITFPDGKEYNHLLTSPMLLRKGKEHFSGLYCLKANPDNSGIEVLIEGKEDFPVYIRHIKTNVQDRFVAVEKLCITLWKVECNHDMSL